MRHAGLALVCALAMLVATGLSAAAPPQAPPERLFSAGDVWEPVAAADPSGPYVYLLGRDLGYRDCPGCPSETLMLLVSADGGATFAPARPLCTQGCAQSSRAQFDPVIDVANDGTAFAMWMDGNSPGAVVSRSTDHGQTWSTPVVVQQSMNGWTDKPWLAISPSGQDVYVAYYGQTRAWIAASHDGALSFAPAVQVTNDNRFWFPEGGTVTPDGTAYITMSSEDTSGAGAVDLAVFRSTNGGASWTAQIVATSEEAPPCTAPGCITDFFQAQLTIASDANGKLVAAYTRTSMAHAPKTLYTITSTSGTSWSAPTVVSTAGDANFQQIAAGPGAGDFRVAWQDDRNGAMAFNTWHKRLAANGKWGSEVRLSNVGTGAPYKTTAGYTFPYGDYMGLDVDGQGVSHAIWGEGTGRKTGGGSWFTRTS